MARPKIEFNQDQINAVRVMAQAQVPDDQIAAYLSCGESTLRRRFGTLLKEGRKAGLASLRSWQFAAAKKGNAAMLIWLGKQLLGQREPRFEMDVNTVKPFVVETSISKTVIGIQGDQPEALPVN